MLGATKQDAKGGASDRKERGATEKDARGRRCLRGKDYRGLGKKMLGEGGASDGKMPGATEKYAR